MCWSVSIKQCTTRCGYRCNPVCIYSLNHLFIMCFFIVTQFLYCQIVSEAHRAWSKSELKKEEEGEEIEKRRINREKEHLAQHKSTRESKYKQCFNQMINMIAIVSMLNRLYPITYETCTFPLPTSHWTNKKFIYRSIKLNPEKTFLLLD